MLKVMKKNLGIEQNKHMEDHWSSVFTQAENMNSYSGRRCRVKVSALQLFLLLSVSHLNMQESFACVSAWSHVKAICIYGRVVSMSDSESVCRGSIPTGRISNLFFPFFFLLEVITFLLFFLFISKSNDISK